MSDRAHEGALEFQRDYISGRMRVQRMSMGEIVFQKLQNFWVAKALMSS